MAIISINITQDNIVNGSNLMPIHSPLIFLADVTYSGLTPDILLIDVIDENSVVLDTFRAIPYKDLLLNCRQFMFIADKVLRGYMDEFDDIVQTANSLIHVAAITKQFTIKFYDPDVPATEDSIDIVACHGVAQFSENPNLDKIFNNDSEVISGAALMPVYAYFYNDDITNVLDVNGVALEVFDAVDYNGDKFVDFNTDQFIINK
jgi:hypothetical protein